MCIQLSALLKRQCLLERRTSFSQGTETNKIRSTRSTTLIGEDTDMLVLLLHYMQQANNDLYFCSDKANADKLYHINELKIVLGEELCSQLLFLHTYTGCDTTSRIFGVGKQICPSQAGER